MTRSSSAADVVLLALLVPACITGGGRPRQLYPGDPRPPAETARLTGSIGTVDGQDVSRLGKSFALLPGCHVVRPPEKVAEIDKASPNSYVASVPSDITFAVRMQPRHTYEIQVRPDENTGHTAVFAAVQAWDRDEQGGATPVPPIASTAELDACQAWKPAP